MHQTHHLKSLIIFLIFFLMAGIITVLLILLPKNIKSNEPSVAATIFPIYDIAKNVAGDAIKVTLILPAGADAHSFEPSPSLIKQLNGTKIVYSIGYQFDDWATVLAQNVGAEIYTLDDGIELLASHDHEDHEESDHEHEEGEEEHEHSHGPIDPHYWLSVKNAKVIAFNIASDLIKRFPEHTDTITANTVEYISKLDVLETETKAALKDIPNKNIVTFHDAWYYFAKEYGLTVAGTFEPTAGREPTPQYLAELVEKISTAGVKTIYYEPQMSITGYQTFANDYNIELKALDDIGGVTPYDSYINLIKTNVSTLQNNQ